MSLLYTRTSEEELKLRRASLVIGVVATLIFICCAAMVAVTLYLTPEMDKLAAGKSELAILTDPPSVNVP